MGVFNIIALTTEAAVLLWYLSAPLVKNNTELVYLDWVNLTAFRQSLAAVALLSCVRLGFFISIRRSSKRAPATRCFVFFSFLSETLLGTLASLQPVIFWRDESSFARYRVLSWGKTFVWTLWGLSLLSTLLQLVYILRMNKSRGRLADDKLMRDVLGEATPTMDARGDDMKGAKWRAKWTQLVKQFKKKRTDPTFEVVVRLYAHHEQAVQRLVTAFDRAPMECEFYLPQLCCFMMANQLALSSQLCAILLEKCSSSHTFAHKMLWYLKSFCQFNSTFSTEANQKRIQILIEEVTQRGVRPALLVAKHSHSQLSGTVDKSSPEKPDDPVDAREVESLLPSREDQYSTFEESSLDLERGTMPQEAFENESRFLTALANLSSNLRSIPVNRRNNSLRTWLMELQTQYLPSNSLYLPVGNPYHRLKKIHVNECFTFSTRERVPYLLCAEVLEYSSPEERSIQRKRSSIFGGRLRLSIFERSSPPETSVAERTPAVSPDSTKLGFWSEKQSLSPRARSFSQHLSTSIAQPGELLNGLLGTIVGKNPSTRFTNQEVKGSNQEALLSEEQDSVRECEASRRSTGAYHPSERSERGSLPGSKAPSLSNCASDYQTNDTWSPRSETPDSPSSVGSPTSPTLTRFDSTDRYLQTLSERDSRDLDDEDQLPVPPSTGRVSDAPCVIFKERWVEKEARIQTTSPWGNLPGWRLLPVIVKSNDDLRQEQLASQLIRQFHKVFAEAKLPVFLRPYDVIATTSNSGLVEAIADTISIDSLKRNDPEFTTLLDFFTRHFGEPSSSEFKKAKSNFVASMAAYSIVCYLLQVKDRHNGNLLLDAEGHLIHIDFGFMLSNNPGNMAFEQAPFKLTSEFVDLMGGARSASFRRFRSLCVRSFLVARKYRHRFILLIEMMIHGNEHLPCFAGDAKGTIERFAARFQPDLDINECEDFVHDLIDASLDNWRTKWYDKYQRWCVGVF